MGVSLGTDAIFSRHDPGPYHPESPARHSAAERGAEGLDIVSVPARDATRAELELAHSPRHVDQILALRGQSVAIDPDTCTCPDTVAAAERAAGLTIDLAIKVAKNQCPPGLALVRPPGHHATSDQAMGFCFFNNVAVAARAAQAQGVAQRVAIYDWDVHHGNGTQAIFYEDDSILYLSTHQHPLYPGTGAADERGSGAGEGSTLNAPLPAGAADAELVGVSRDVLEPAVRRFAPDLILISAGYDAFIGDPLGGLRITTEGFHELSKRWKSLADALCDGKIAGVLEGGYDLPGLTACVGATLRAWS